MSEIMYKLLNIRFIKVLLYCDNDYVGKIITKDQGQEFIRHKRFGTYILPRTNIAYFRHGTEKRINYNVDFIQPLIPKYNKFDFFDKKNLDIRDLKRLKVELWDSIDKTTKLSPEYISELKERTYTESDIISLKYENNITPLELSHIISGEEIKLIMKNDKADWSWLLLPMLAFSVVIGLMVIMVGIPT
jgi:hypothetical protein